MLSRRFALTFVVPILQDVFLPGLRRSEIARALELSVQSSRLCGSPVGPSSKCLAQVPSTHPFVTAFVTASAQLNEMVACITLQCLAMGLLQI